MLGVVWSLAHPVVLMLVYLLVFSVMLKIQTADYEHYWLFLLCRPAGVGVLRDIAPVGRPEPAGEREPDPEGALPSPARAALDRGDPAGRLRRDAGDRRRAQPRLCAGGPRHRLARDPTCGSRGLPRRRALARRRLAQRALSRCGASGGGAPPAMVLPDPRALLTRGHPGRARITRVSSMSSITAIRSRLRSRLCAIRSSSASFPLRPTRSTSPSRRCSRSRSARSSSAAWTTAWQSKSDPAVEDRRLAVRLVGGKPFVLSRLDSGQEGRQQKRVSERRVSAAPGSPRAEGPVACLDRAADRGEALGVRVQHTRRPVRLGQGTGDEVRRRDRVLVDERLRLCGDRCAGCLVCRRRGR